MAGQNLEENELIGNRKAKLENITKAGIYAYGGKFETSTDIKTLKENFAEDRTIALAGRIMAIRAHGKSIFYDVKEMFDQFERIWEDYLAK